jgi:hypothetical protein
VTEEAKKEEVKKVEAVPIVNKAAEEVKLNNQVEDDLDDLDINTNNIDELELGDLKNEVDAGNEGDDDSHIEEDDLTIGGDANAGGALEGSLE